MWVVGQPQPCQSSGDHRKQSYKGPREEGGLQSLLPPEKPELETRKEISPGPVPPLPRRAPCSLYGRPGATPLNRIFPGKGGEQASLGERVLQMTRELRDGGTRCPRCCLDWRPSASVGPRRGGGGHTSWEQLLVRYGGGQVTHCPSKPELD